MPSLKWSESSLDMMVIAIIVAAGKGQRMSQNKPKQFLKLLDRPILVHTLEVFEKSSLISEVILLVPKGTLEYSRKEIIKKYKLKKIVKIIVGGRQRQDSVYKGLKEVNKKCRAVIVHDGVRPFVTNRMISESLKNLKKYKACIFVLPVKDTVKRINKNNLVRETLVREELGLVQTPQTFDAEVLRKAYKKAFKDKFYATDDAMLVERLGERVKVLVGSYENIKITTPEDLILAEFITKSRLKLKGVK